MTDSPRSDATGNAQVDRLVAKAIELRRAGQLDASAAHFEQALAYAPQHPGALASYSMLLLEVGDLSRAIQFSRQAVVADPGLVSAHNVLGRAQVRSGLVAEGLATLRLALALSPGAATIHLDLGNALLEAGELDTAEWHMTRAHELSPALAQPLIMLGNLRRRQREPAAAVALYRRAIECDKSIPQAYNNLGTVLAEVGDGDGAVAALRHALALAPNRPSTWSNLLLTLTWSDRVTTDELAAEHRAFGRHFGKLIHPLPSVMPAPLGGRRLKIGYLSSDFHSHAVALFVLPLLQHHDRAQFDVHAFHNLTTGDDVTTRIEELVEHFVPVAGMSDDELARHVRAAKIDILVDLNGHTARNRLLVFLQKPAPVQVTWLGYLATTGLATMDYRLTDGRADPAGATDWQYTETQWRLPATAWCYEPYEFALDSGPLPAHSNGHVTFGALNNPGKVSRTVLGLWIRILTALPAARLLMITSPFGERVAEIDRVLAEGGIAAERVEHIPRQSGPHYLALYNRIDIALDTWPCAGGTTTCDALWMGVPVVTLAEGRSFARTGASLLASVGLSDLVATQPDEYVAHAVTLAQDFPRIAGLRATLRDRMRHSPLTDGPRFARAVEEAFLAMARQRLPP